MATAPQVVERVGAGGALRHVPLVAAAGTLLLAVAAIGLLQVMQTSHNATVGYQLRALEQERGNLTAEVRLLETNVAELTRPEQIRLAATTRLGMAPAQQVLRIAVAQPAPATVPLPERYITPAQTTPPAPIAWWERLLQRLPGFH